MITHEAYIARIAECAISRLADGARKAQLQAIKLTYGAGPDGVRGITYYNRWIGKGGETAVPFVGINAMSQSNPIQLAGTTIHELGHVLAGWEAGHGKGWHDACEELGLRRIKAAGTNYVRAMFAPDIRALIARLPSPDEGEPVNSLAGLAPLLKTGKRMTIKPCAAGIGTRGGVSRGVGSGSRLLKYACDGIGHKATIVRASAGANFDATCNHCQTAFRLAD